MKKLLLLLLAALPLSLYADKLEKVILDTLEYYTEPFDIAGKYNIEEISVEEDSTFVVNLGELFGSIPYRKKLVDKMERGVKRAIGDEYKDFKIELRLDDTNIRKLIPNYTLNKSERDASKYNKKYTCTTPFVRNIDRPYKVTRGLQDRNLALWQSHGLYYNQELDRWIWQRARVFTTVEDKFTLSFVIPYLMPMLDRAGANVMMPRERDTQTHEVVVDNDATELIHGDYIEKGKFKTAKEAGFGYNNSVYINMQNPFEDGTYRTCNTKKEGSASVQWVPDIPEDGWYWVSISYATTPKSIKDAKYTVNHSAGSTTFEVNQKMGGGTWIYLGQFYFEKGKDASKGSIVLSNESDNKGEITADAVRFGGGMGNIARRPITQKEADKVIEDKKLRAKVAKYYQKDNYEVSGVRRFWEGSRYWLQWAGAPKDVISITDGVNDYSDDYSGRGLWVNWLNNGSVNARNAEGLGIPIDLAMAWHSDAGSKIHSIIGTLGIYTTHANNKKGPQVFPNGQSRFASRDLTDIIMGQVVGDIQKSVNPNWTRRWMWDRNYSESRRPEVPSMLMESLSHQNFDDMQYGLDPRFKFLMARAVYKGMVKFIAHQNGRSYVIAPLPVKNFAAEFAGTDSVKLTWDKTYDPLEKSAVAKGYVIYTRKDGKGWDNGIYSECDSIVLSLNKKELTSYKVVAVNEGGASLDSEILSVYRADSDKTVMVVNGFDRICGPEGFEALPYAGFPDWLDRGVGDGVELQFVGKQHDFDSRREWESDDDAGWGQSDSDYEFMPIAGNSHDYPLVHGKAIAAAGYSFVSCSRGAVENGCISLSDYDAADLILGEQKETLWGDNVKSCEFRTFSVNLQKELREYTAAGGALMVTGAYVVSDNWLSKTATEEDRKFVKDVLKVEWRADRAAQNGHLSCVYAPNMSFEGDYRFVQNLNDTIYAVESPDALIPACSNAYTVMRYSQNTTSAAVAYSGRDYRAWVGGFPFETMENEDMRRSLMKQILKFLLR